ncbi:MAG TPA: helix-turn-helix domain-containing protein [Dehalococcoidia bacterium]|nr:helix-turn-helix domain-containing protein [Dehalococcoidia bacterium]
MATKRSQADRTEQTRRLLLDVGRRLFTERGYAGTATEEIVRQAGVTRGALYYHFKDKQDLFRAVVEDVQQESMARLAVAAGAIADPWQRMRTAMQAFLDNCLEPAMRQIVLIDGPAVLGWPAWREMDERYGLGATRTALQAAVDAGQLEPQPLEPLAHLLLGALGEAGMLLAEAPDPPAARAEVGESLDRLLAGLRAV